MLEPPTPLASALARAASLAARAPVPLLYVAFAASGLVGLVYQVVWQRLLTLFAGADVASVTVIVAAFMAGLGLGSLVGGAVADRLTARESLLAFVLAELAIAVFAWKSTYLLHEVLYAKLATLAAVPLVPTLILFSVLLWPTFFMGTTLPLIARALAGTAAAAPARVAELQAANTAGAALGALLTGWWLVRRFGLDGSVQIGVVVQLVCAAIVFAVAWRVHRPSAALRAPAPAPASTGTAALLGLPFWALCAAVAGFVALALEVLWVRLLGTVMKATAFTFPTLLAIYLGGLAAGCLLGRWWEPRVRRPALAYFALQAAVPSYAAAALAFFFHAVPRYAVLRRVWEHLGAYELIATGKAIRALQHILVFQGADLAAPERQAGVAFAWTSLVLPALLIGPATLLMGASVAFLQRCIQSDPALVGRRVGWIQAAGIAGGTAGVASTGLLLLTWIGSLGVLALTLLAGVLFLGLAAWAAAGPWRWVLAAAAVATPVLTYRALPDPVTLLSRLHGVMGEPVTAQEDASGIALVKGSGYPGVVHVNGLGRSWIPYGGDLHTVLGALPVLLHPHPVEVAVIGLGSGDTLFATGSREEVRLMHCVEIVAPLHPTLQLFAERAEDAGLRAILGDRRARHYVGDGRTFLLRGGRYDVIEADALRPDSAGGGALYSVEFFDLMRRQLKPGGLGVTWKPTERAGRTFRAAFPHVLDFGPFLVGSATPIPWNPAAIEARAGHAFTSRYFGRAGLDVLSILAAVLHGPAPKVYGPEDRRGLEDINTDLFPRDEYLDAERFRGWGP